MCKRMECCGLWWTSSGKNPYTGYTCKWSLLLFRQESEPVRLPNCHNRRLTLLLAYVISKVSVADQQWRYHYSKFLLERIPWLFYPVPIKALAGEIVFRDTGLGNDLSSYSFRNSKNFWVQITNRDHVFRLHHFCPQ